MELDNGRSVSEGVEIAFRYMRRERKGAFDRPLYIRILGVPRSETWLHTMTVLLTHEHSDMVRGWITALRSQRDEV